MVIQQSRNVARKVTPVRRLVHPSHNQNHARDARALTAPEGSVNMNIEGLTEIGWENDHDAAGQDFRRCNLV
jgi:hypothetical protein